MTADEILARARARASANRTALGVESDSERIAALPAWKPDDDEQDALAERWTLALRLRRDARRLRPVQAYALEAAFRASKPQGVLLEAGVGSGKTLALRLMATVMNAVNPLLLLYSKDLAAAERAAWEWGQEYGIRPCTIRTYESLSRPDATAMLRVLAPDLILADECHALRHADAVRTKRFLRYMRANPEVRFVGASGTLMTNGVRDYAHLSELALREASPLPTDGTVLKQWAAVMDFDGEPDDAAWAAVEPLVRWVRPTWRAPSASTSGDRDVEACRQALAERKASAPGFVVTTRQSCEEPLSLRAVYPDLRPDVKAALSSLHRDYVLPDGTPVVDALHFHRAAQQLSLGFWYEWVWPNDEPDLDWLDARSTWASAVRRYLKSYSREGCDSPFLVEEYVRRAPLSQASELRNALAAWDEQRDKDEPPTRAVWIDTGPVEFAVEWAKQQDPEVGAFLWFRNRAVGELLQQLGVPCFWQEEPQPAVHRIAGLSIRVHSAGKNYQPWGTQLVMEPGSSAAEWEQLLGRQHRQGRVGAVHADVYQHTWPQKQAFKKALAKAENRQTSSGQPEKLLVAERRDFPGVFTHNPYE